MPNIWECSEGFLLALVFLCCLVYTKKSIKPLAISIWKLANHHLLLDQIFCLHTHLLYSKSVKKKNKEKMTKVWPGQYDSFECFISVMHKLEELWKFF